MEKPENWQHLIHKTQDEDNPPKKYQASKHRQKQTPPKKNPQKTKMTSNTVPKGRGLKSDACEV